VTLRCGRGKPSGFVSRNRLRGRASEHETFEQLRHLLQVTKADMQIDRGRPQVVVAQQCLHRQQIDARFEPSSVSCRVMTRGPPSPPPASGHRPAGTSPAGAGRRLLRARVEFAMRSRFARIRVCGNSGSFPKVWRLDFGYGRLNSPEFGPVRSDRGDCRSNRSRINHRNRKALEIIGIEGEQMRDAIGLHGGNETSIVRLRARRLVSNRIIHPPWGSRATRASNLRHPPVR